MTAKRLIIPRKKFLDYRGVFHKQVMSQHNELELIKINVISNPEDPEDSFKKFIGDSEKTETIYKVPCFFKYSITQKQREKFGLEQDVSCISYLSPIYMQETFGDFIFDSNIVKVKFYGETFLIHKVRYLERMYGSCVGIQLELKTAIRGG